MAGRREHGAAAGLRPRRRAGAARAARMDGYERNTGIHVPHRTCMKF